MNQPTKPPVGGEDAMEDYFQRLHAKNLDALWRGFRPYQNPGRRPSFKAAHWAAQDWRPALRQAGEMIKPGPEAERRVVQFVNPDLPGSRSASHTLTANVQLVLPGEISPSHRHSVAAIRFIIEGEAAVTVVNGEPIPMHPGDLVLTPGGYWHGHVNNTDRPAIWMDSLDRLIVLALRQWLQEPDGEELQASTQPADAGLLRYGAGWLQPLDRKASSGLVSPIMRYPWDDTRRALDHLAQLPADPFDDVVMDYVNPTNGRHVTPTIGCRIQMIRAGVHTKAHRHAHVSVQHVFRGEGATIIEGVEYRWKAGDFFVIPPWSWHEHINLSAEPAYLFSTIDQPVLESLALAGEEAFPHDDGHQKLIGNA